MRRHLLAGRLLAALTQVLEAGFYLDLLCTGAGLLLAAEVFFDPGPPAPRPAPRRPPRPGLAARPRGRGGLSSRSS